MASTSEDLFAAIEAGKRADLLLVDGDPVEDPPTLLGRRSVWQAGVRV